VKCHRQTISWPDPKFTEDLPSGPSSCDYWMVPNYTLTSLFL